MTESNQNEIINRLQKLEKQNRYMKLGGLAIVLLAVTTLLTGASKKPEIAEEIRAKKIVLVDEQGKEVIVMDSLNNNVSRINIFDSKGKIRLCLGAVDGNPILGMNDPNGNNRLRLTADDTSSLLSLSDSKGNLRLYLAADDAISRLSLGDPNGNLRLDLMADDASSLLSLSDSKGNHRLGLSASDTGSMLSLRDSNEKNRLGLVADDASSSLSLRDSKGNVRLGMASRDDEDNGGLMEIYNKTNESVVQLRVDEYGNGLVGAYNRKGLGKTLTPGP